MKAADLYKKVVDYYDELVKYWENISKDKMKFCLYFYNYRLDNMDEPFKYFELSDKHIESALSIISKLNITTSQDFIEKLEYDRKRWKYFKLQNEPHYQSLLARKAINENKISVALDYYKSIKDKSEKLIEITSSYLDILDPNYERIVLRNFYKASSNYAFKLSEL